MMGVDRPLFDWAYQRFGEHTDEVRQHVAQALLEAMNDAQDAQRSSRSDKQYAYGSTLMARRYETIVARLGSRSDVEIIKPHGSPHELAIVDGNLLFPFRYSKDGRTPISEARVSDRRVSGLIRELFRLFSPEPSYEQESLDLFSEAESETELDPLRPVLSQLPDNTHLVLIAYSGNAQAGLFNVYWGEAELIDEFGRIRWTHQESIPLLLPSTYDGRHLALTGAGVAGEGLPRRFDGGAVPETAMVTRSGAERKNAKISPMHSEPSSEIPVAGGDERR